MLLLFVLLLLFDLLFFLLVLFPEDSWAFFATSSSAFLAAAAAASSSSFFFISSSLFEISVILESIWPIKSLKYSSGSFEISSFNEFKFVIALFKSSLLELLISKKEDASVNLLLYPFTTFLISSLIASLLEFILSFNELISSFSNVLSEEISFEILVNSSK